MKVVSSFKVFYGFFFLSKWKNGVFDCFGSPKDCLIGYCLPCVSSYMASTAAGNKGVMNIVNCLCYPFAVPFLRKQVREKKKIDVSCLT